tara:strand:- start:1199 stop:1480 length:282 start_codon:yes stop_codon:yes gene_type:complete
MDFYKKTLFIVFIIIFTFAVLVKILEPVVEKQVKNIFADKKFSNKMTEELINSTDDFSEEKRDFYKEIIKKLYIKWVPLIEEAKNEAEIEINK